MFYGTSVHRKEINERLRKKIADKKPIVIGGAGIGLVAKIADQTGIDLIMGYNTGPFRMDGHGSLSGYLAYGDSQSDDPDSGRAPAEGHQGHPPHRRHRRGRPLPGH